MTQKQPNQPMTATSAVKHVYGMKRSISESDAQAVVAYYNRTADQLGLPRPLTPTDWYAVKEYLRGPSFAGYTASWTEADAQLHAMACSDLAIDPAPTLPGLRGAAFNAFMWLGSPADRHGCLGEFLRILAIISLGGLVGGLFMLVAHFISPAHSSDAFRVGALLAALAFGLVISSDTMAGVFGLLLSAVCGYALATHDWVEPFWNRALAGGALGSGVVIGFRLFLASIQR